MEQRIEKLRNCDGLVGLEALGEVIPLEELGYGEPPGKVYHVCQVEFAEPLALPDRVCAIPVHHFKELAHVRVGVLDNLFVCEHRARGRLTAGVTDLCSPVAYNQDHPVAQLLKLAQLTKPHDVTEVNVGAAWVEAHLQT